MTTPYRTLQTPEERLVYTVAEAGELLGISRAFAYELVARGELPVIWLGRRRLVPKVALLALVGQTRPRTRQPSRPRLSPGALHRQDGGRAPRTTTCAPSPRAARSTTPGSGESPGYWLGEGARLLGLERRGRPGRPPSRARRRLAPRRDPDRRRGGRGQAGGGLRPHLLGPQIGLPPLRALGSATSRPPSAPSTPTQSPRPSTTSSARRCASAGEPAGLRRIGARGTGRRPPSCTAPRGPATPSSTPTCWWPTWPRGTTAPGRPPTPA